jgi:hypothetical protein
VRIKAPWNDRLAEPLAKEHLVHLYDDDSVLVEGVALYAGRGLGKGEAVVLIATAEHLEAIERRLLDAGLETADLKAWGQLVCIEAAPLLVRFLDQGGIDTARFHAILADILGQVRGDGRFSKVRLYGEMVNLLWRHNHPATRRLEELWNDAIEAHSVSLLCGYRVDGGHEREIPSDLQALHSHLIPLEAGA